MAFVVAVVIGFTVLDGAARWLVIIGGAAIEVVEAFFLMWLSRRRAPATGLEPMVGREAVVAVACRPDGQVRIDGELWAARCVAGAERGDRVTIVAVDRLTLTVEARVSGAAT